jgi:hypothetical protein
VTTLSPLLHFLIVGGACFLLSRWWSGGWPAEPEPSTQRMIFVAEATIARMQNDWIRRFGSPPGAIERQTMIDAEINDEILHREALRLGLHLIDPVIDRRLTQNMRFVAADGNGAYDLDDVEDEALIEQALELDMVATDLVVRRRLIHQMRSMLEASAAPPTPAEVRDYVQQHRDRFSTPRRFVVSYRFDPGDGGAVQPPPLFADTFSDAKLALHFGQDGAAQIVALAPGEWTAPIRRGEGEFRVRLDERLPARPVAFEHVRERALHAVSNERRHEAYRRGMQRLREFYQIRIGVEARDVTSAPSAENAGRLATTGSADAAEAR